MQGSTGQAANMNMQGAGFGEGSDALYIGELQWVGMPLACIGNAV